jgi:hypothetical protein
MNFISYRKSELYDRVVEEHDVFEHSYDFMVFLAVLGYREGEPVRDDYKGSSAEGTKGEIGAENFFANDLYRMVTACIAFQDTGDPAALVDQELQAEKLAQYAAGGLEVAEEKFGQTAGDPTNAILNYLKQYQDSDTYQGTLGEIVKAFDDEMMGIQQG